MCLDVCWVVCWVVSVRKCACLSERVCLYVHQYVFACVWVYKKEKACECARKKSEHVSQKRERVWVYMCE